MKYAERKDLACRSAETASEGAQGSPELPGDSLSALLKDGMLSVVSCLQIRFICSVSEDLIVPVADIFADALVVLAYDVYQIVISAF